MKVLIPYLIMALSTLVAASLMIGLAHAYAPATEPIPTPKPRPIMACWITKAGATNCLVRG